MSLSSTIVLAQQNMNLLGQETFNETASDIWGYAANSREYALVGLNTGVAIVDVTDPTNPDELQFLQGYAPGTDWWDIKTWGNYAYVINEGGNGLMIIDLSNLPGTATSTFWTTGNYSTAHDIFIDENGIAYIVGMNILNGGVLMLDLNTNPTNPTVIGNYTTTYVHDLYVRGDTMWTANVNDGEFAVVDISNKANPVLMAVQATTKNTTHNLWLSDDGNYLFTTDEVTDAYIESYDVSDLNNITRLDLYQSSPGENVIPHNVFLKGNFGIISYYRDGVVVIDVTYPDNVVEVGNFDTSPNYSGNGFNGCWGVYPYLPSGNIIASDIEEGLYVLGVNYVQAAQLDGTVTDANTTLPISNAVVTIQNQNITANTSTNGEYVTGILSSGQFNIIYSKTGYVSQVEQNVLLQNGVRNTVDVQLTASTNTSLTLTVKDSATNTPIPNAQVLIESPAGFSTYYTADASGVLTINSIPSDYYYIYAGQWGHVTRKWEGIVSGGTIDLLLPEGYYDDFLFDLQWSTTSNASSGDWERDLPNGTDYNGAPSNPGTDANSDFGGLAFVTGNSASGTAGTDDIDDGTVTLTSPYFNLTNYTDPILKFNRWFYNDGGSSTPNDEMVVALRTFNGTTTTLETVNNNTAPNANSWSEQVFRLNDLLSAADSFQLIVTASDNTPGHIAEAGLDKFVVIDSVPPAFKPLAAFSTNDTVICAGSSITIIDESDEDPTNWAWSFPGGFPTSSTQQNPTVSYSTSGNYTVQLIASNALGADTVTKTNYIHVDARPIALFDIYNVSCPGSNDGALVVSDSLQGLGTILWSTGSTSANLSQLEAGTYTVTLTNTAGCSSTKQVQVASPPNFQIGLNLEDATSATNADGEVTILINGGEGPFSFNITGNNITPITDSIAYLSPGTYQATVFDANGCMRTQSFTMNLTVGVQDVIEMPQLQVSPNPFSENVVIYSDSPAEVIIYNISGKIVHRAHINAKESLNWGSKAIAGTYIIELSTEQGVTQQKLLKL